MGQGKTEITESTVVTRTLLNAIKSYGLSPEDLLEAVGWEGGLSESLDARVPALLQKKLLDKAVGLTGDPLFGLKVGKFMVPEDNNVLWYAIQNCRTALEGLDLGIRYTRFFSDVVRPEKVVSEKYVGVVLGSAFDIQVWDPAVAEFAISVWAHTLLSFREGIDKIKEVHFQHQPLDTPEKYEEVLRTNVKFNMPKNQFLMDKQLLELENARAETPLKGILTRVMDEVLDNLKTSHATATKVQGLLKDGLSQGNDNLEWVASELGVSPRTLQGQLSREDTSFTALLEGLRRELASSYLKKRELPIKDIAFLLGFSNLESFYRAFQRWFQETPARYREKLLHPEFPLQDFQSQV